MGAPHNSGRVKAPLRSGKGLVEGGEDESGGLGRWSVTKVTNWDSNWRPGTDSDWGPETDSDCELGVNRTDTRGTGEARGAGRAGATGTGGTGGAGEAGGAGAAGTAESEEQGHWRGIYKGKRHWRADDRGEREWRANDRGERHWRANDRGERYWRANDRGERHWRASWNRRHRSDMAVVWFPHSENKKCM